jgi:hypothetical protein
MASLSKALMEHIKHAHQVAQKAIVISLAHKTHLEKQESRIENLENKLPSKKIGC